MVLQILTVLLSSTGATKGTIDSKMAIVNSAIAPLRSSTY